MAKRMRSRRPGRDNDKVSGMTKRELLELVESLIARRERQNSSSDSPAPLTASSAAQPVKVPVAAKPKAAGPGVIGRAVNRVRGAVDAVAELRTRFEERASAAADGPGVIGQATRGFGIAQAVYRVVMRAVGEVKGYYADYSRASRAKINSYNATQDIPIEARGIRDRVNASTVGALDANGAVNYYLRGREGDVSEENAQRVGMVAGGIKKGVAAPQAFGINPEAVRNEIAKKTGKNSNFVTDWEVRQEIAGRMAKRQQDTNIDQTVQSRAILEDKDASGLRRQAAGTILRGVMTGSMYDVGSGLYDAATAGRRAESEMSKIRDEMKAADASGRVADFEQRQRLLEQAIAEMPQQEKMARERAIQDAQADLASDQRRHRVRWTD